MNVDDWLLIEQNPAQGRGKNNYTESLSKFGYAWRITYYFNTRIGRHLKTFQICPKPWSYEDCSETPTISPNSIDDGIIASVQNCSAKPYPLSQEKSYRDRMPYPGKHLESLYLIALLTQDLGH